jgi:AMMECR1 domain-containing protein
MIHSFILLLFVLFLSPLFITWKIKDRLRGCIGNFEGMPLHAGLLICFLIISIGLKKYAVIAGTQDHRFSPITKNEFPRLNVHVSLLHSFETCSKWDDWEV